MALTLKSLRNNYKSVSLMIAGGKLNLTIDPHYLTQARMDEYRDASENEDYETMAHIFGNIVREWDLLEEEGGEPLPIDAHTLEHVLPVSVTSRIWDEISTATAPKSRKKRGN